MAGTLCARLFTKGAAEILLEQCTTYVAEDSSVEYLTDEKRQQIMDSLSADGNRSVTKVPLLTDLQQYVAAPHPRLMYLIPDMASIIMAFVLVPNPSTKHEIQALFCLVSTQ